jgi:hypothetical protein
MVDLEVTECLKGKIEDACPGCFVFEEAAPVDHAAEAPKTQQSATPQTAVFFANRRIVSMNIVFHLF